MDTVISQNKGEAQLENLENLYELSPMQQGMLFHSIYSPNSGDYFEQSLFTIKGDLNVAAFERAWELMLERHPILRTSFLWEDLEKPLQVVYRRVNLPLANHDWRNLPSEERELKLQSFIKEDRSQGFVLSSAPLMRLALFRFTNDEHKFVFSRHHVVLDRWSRSLLLKDLFAAYHAFAEGKEPSLKVTRPYVDYISWLAKQDANAAERYWRNSLAGFTEPTSLEIGGRTHRSLDETKPYNEQRIQLSEETTAKLSEFARQHRLTLNTVVQGAWALLLSRYTGKDDVVFGATMAGRPADLTGVESMVGLFINTLPARVRMPPSMRVLPWLKQLHAQQNELQQFEYCSLLDIQGWSDVPRGVPLFESILVFENVPVGSNYHAANNSLKFSDDRGFGSTTGYPLTVLVSPSRRLTIKIIYDLTRYSDKAIHRLLIHFQALFENLLTMIVADPDVQVSQVPLHTDSELRQVVFDWNNTRAEFPNNCIHRMFEEQVSSYAQRVAFICGNEQLTYAELNVRANQLAHYLLELGVKPETRVGIYLSRSLEMVIALLSVLKAGAAYVALDPSYPSERLAFMIKDANVPVILTKGTLPTSLPSHQARVVALDDEWQIIQRNSGANIVGESFTDSPAYVLYTSGSTGTPKGVLGLHGATINRFHWMWQQYPFAAGEVCCQKTSVNFGDSIWEIFGPLLQGVPNVILGDEVVKDPHYLIESLIANNVTRIVLVPSLLRVMLEQGEKLDQRLSRLKYWVCSGETLSVDLAESFRRKVPNGLLINLYGSSEVAADVSCYEVTNPANLSSIPIGQPIANTQLYILDPNLEPLPVGIPGELFVGGESLARGYLDRPKLTAEKFIPNPFSDGSYTRLFRTGDLARHLPDGTIEYLGRLDHQVKIRGFRIELGEIEAVLRQHESVRETVVVAREDTVGDRRLVAYVVPSRTESDALNTSAREDSSPKLMSELRRYLQQRLPEYMVPAIYVELSKLPLNPNGKVDRRALPAPGNTRLELEEVFVAPRSATEEKLASIWGEVLKVDRIGINDNFFDLGGHSLLATQVIGRIRKLLQIDLPLRTLFESPTIKGLSETLRDITQTATGDGLMPAITPVSRNMPLPLSFAQQRLWFLNELEGDSAFYNVPWAVRLRGELDIKALREALDTIINRHETLRTSFSVGSGQPFQVISDSSNLAFSITDLSELPEELLEHEAKRLSGVEARQPFDLQTGPLLRARLLRLRTDDYVLFVTTHHIVSDGWSIGIFMHELTELYESFVSGRPHSLPELAIQYADYAAWQRKWLEGQLLQNQLTYWKEQLQGIPAVLELPKDRPRPAVQTFHGATRPLQLKPGLTKALNDLSQREGVTLFMTLLAAFQVLLSRYTAQADIVVGSPIAGRKQEETERLIGLFVNTLLLRTDLSGNPTFRELLGRVKEVALGAYANQELPFERLVDELQPERSLSHAPLFQVMFVLQNAPRAEFKLSGLTLTRMRIETRTSKFDLSLFATEIADNLNLILEYNTDLFDDARIERMLEHLQTLLEGIVRKPETRIGDLEILTKAENERLLVDLNETAEEVHATCIHQLFEEQVERIPEKIAVVFEGEELTYQELNRRANQLAHYLKRRGIGPEVLVAVCVERSLEMLVALLGILKAGGAYVPLDPAYPAERLRFMLEDANAQLVLTQERLLKLLPESQAEVFCLDRDWPRVTNGSDANPLTTTAPENLAYVIYTSGSTGKPKGVAIQHRSALALLTWAQSVFFEEELSGVLASTSICFDLSVFELFVPLSCGGRVLLVENALQLMSTGLAKQVKLINTVPSAMTELLRLGGVPQSVQTVNLAGEPLRQDLVEKLYELPHINRVNDLYGPSEDTTYSTHAVRRSGGPATIGRPISGTRVYLLDRNLQPVPIGVPGELYLSGAGLARGYLNRPELTARVFIPDPFQADPGGRLYKTGDMAQYFADGNIEYLGRVDNQVKLRGFRIELGEIEQAIKKHPRVSEAIVLAREDDPGDRRLVAYVIPAGVGVSSKELRDDLRKTLPEYMLPAAIVEIKELPLTPNGKIDRRALPAPQLSRSGLETQFESPRTQTEEVLASIWSEILKIDRIGIHDNFFHLGGHSLLATQVISRVRNRFNIEFSLRRLFEYPTLARLADAVSQAQKEGKANSELQIKPRQRDRSKLLKNINDLSPEQIDALLSEVYRK